MAAQGDSAASFLSWLEDAFARLPKASDPILERLWRDNRLHFPGVETDRFDVLSAQLVYAALTRRTPILVVVPDRSPHRAPLLFATALIMHALDRGRSSLSGGNVTYFGSTVGIRAQLEAVSVGELKLHTVFSQTHLTRTGSITQRTGDANSLGPRHLPGVISAYSPPDPVAVCQSWNPQWVAIDCGDESSLPWLRPLANHCVSRGIAFVAWSQNPLSDVVDEFRRVSALVFPWPPASASAAADSSSLRASLLAGSTVDRLEAHLKPTLDLLVTASRELDGAFERDAVSLAWRYFRTLEAMPVPLSRYEAGTKGLWGVPSVARLRAGLTRFVSAAQSVNPRLSGRLEQIAVSLDAAAEFLAIVDPPLWTALSELCVSEPPRGAAQLVIFPTAARKYLFALALLAAYNISEDDLRELRVWLVSAKELRRLAVSRSRRSAFADGGDVMLPPQQLQVSSVIVGVPCGRGLANCEPAFREKATTCLLYAYQLPAFRRLTERVSRAFTIEPDTILTNLTRLGGIPQKTPPPAPRASITVDESVALPAAPSRATPRRPGPSKSVWTPTDRLDEVARLLETLDDTEDVTPGEGTPSLADDQGATDSAEWVEDAIQLRFDNGSSVLLAPDEQINVVSEGPSGDEVDEVYVRSVRPGDGVLFIHGQRRQSLYALIISRVHRHPAIEVHVALVRRWQDDFAAYKTRHARSGMTVEDLLQALRDRGSDLESPSTLRSWLRGERLAPDDPEDLRRLADILELRFVREYYPRIFRAASRLRGLHRGLANRLNRWLRDRSVGAGAEALDSVFDAELGLSLQDFHDSLLLLTVATVEPLRGPFLRASLGKLNMESAA